MLRGAASGDRTNHESRKFMLCKKSFAVNQVSKETGVTKGLVSRCLNYPNTAGLLNRSGHSYCPDDDAHNASVDGRAVTRAVKVLLNLNTLNIGSLDHGWAAGVGVYEGKSYIPKEETGYYVLEDPGFGDVAEGCCAAGRCGWYSRLTYHRRIE